MITFYIIEGVNDLNVFLFIASVSLILEIMIFFLCSRSGDIPFIWQGK